MCGLTGFVDFAKGTSPFCLQTMTDTLAHRGPDANGVRILDTPHAQIGLGHARLSILDLSSDGKQPMSYRHLSIVFNGEIYNYKELKQELKKQGHQFITRTDTEVILHAFDAWGEQAIDRFIGMFSIAIYNAKTEKLSLFRDRAGVKPMYYFEKNGFFLFGSELKALMGHPQFKKEIDSSVLLPYFQLGYIPAPHTIFKNCYKLKPGHRLDYNMSSKSYSSMPYWNVRDYYASPKLSMDYPEAKDALSDLLVSAFQYRMVSDVPVGVFLSGGYDSTAVASILQANQLERIKTFTIGFEEGNNEAPFAKQTAAHLGTDHYEYICTTAEAQKIIPQLPYFYDEPFGDSSAIPTSLVSQLARKEVTVALSADGGDEIFCGYTSYFNLERQLARLNQVPSALKPVLSAIAGSVSITNKLVSPALQHKAHTALTSLDKNDYRQASQLFQKMKEKPLSYLRKFFSKDVGQVSSPYDIDYKSFASPLEGAMAADYLSYLPDDILTKVDRSTMSVSLEGRDPLLDHRIIEFAARLPLDYKYGGGKNGKRILKDIVHDYVPQKMMDRPKAGFSLPIYSWLRGDLSYLVEEYLSETALARSGLFNVSFVRKQVALFMDRKLHYSPLIWYLLMFQMWWSEWMEK